MIRFLQRAWANVRWWWELYRINKHLERIQKDYYNE